MGYLNLRVVFTRALKTGQTNFKPAPGRLLFVLLREWGALDLYDSVEPWTFGIGALFLTLKCFLLQGYFFLLCHVSLSLSQWYDWIDWLLPYIVLDCDGNLHFCTFQLKRNYYSISIEYRDQDIVQTSIIQLWHKLVRDDVLRRLIKKTNS